MKSTSSKGGLTLLRQYLPILEWLPQYQLAWLKTDLIAGLTIWAVMVPEAMAYAGIAGVPPLIGLYTVPLPLFAYAFLGTSRTMVVGPDTATAVISSVTVGALAASGSQDYLLFTSALAAIVGVLFLGFGLLKMGWVANFIPTPVMRGFIQGLVWVTIIGQVPKLFGIEGGSGNFLQKLATIIERLPEAHGATTAIGVTSVVLLFLLKEFVPKLPGALTAAIMSIIAVTALGLEDRGVELVGQIQTGLPSLQVPAVTVDQIKTLIPGALAIVLLGYSETLGAAKTAAQKTGEELDPNQELVSHGPANLGSALCSGFVVVGSLSKTSVAMTAGAKTQVSSLVNGGLVVLTLLFLMPFFQNLSHATLGAIVIEAMLGLASFSYLKNLHRVSPLEHAVALVAFFGVLFLGVLQGIGYGVILSLVLLIKRASYPGTAVLGRLPGQKMYRNVLRRPDAEIIPGLLIFRFSSDLIYPNAAYFDSQLKTAIKKFPDPIEQVLVDASSINFMDTTAMEMLAKLKRELGKQGIALSFASVRDSVRDLMGRTGLEGEIGTQNYYELVHDGVEAFQNETREVR
ncbi:MAG: SulP family inorganic anion transporter [Synechococcus sp.]